MSSERKVCILTGGSLGIGLAITHRFCQAGYEVFNLDIRDFEAPIDHATWLSCDVTDSKSVERCIEGIVDKTKRIDTLIANAGKHMSATIEETSEHALQELFDVNVKGAFTAIKSVLPTMRQQKNGSIVIVGSDQSLVGKRNSFAYNLTKMALASMTKTTALDYASFNIRVNAVCPGTIETPLFHHAIDRYVSANQLDKAEVIAEEARMQPLGRIGQPNDVAELAFFLASENASFITGSLHPVDGGYTAQ